MCLRGKGEVWLEIPEPEAKCFTLFRTIVVGFATRFSQDLGTGTVKVNRLLENMENISIKSCLLQASEFEILCIRNMPS